MWARPVWEPLRPSAFPANEFHLVPQGRVSGRVGLLVALVVGSRHHQLLQPQHPAALGPVRQLRRPRQRRQASAASVHHATLLLLHELPAKRGRNPLVQLVPAVQILLGLVAVAHQLPGAAPSAEQVEHLRQLPLAAHRHASLFV